MHEVLTHRDNRLYLRMQSRERNNKNPAQYLTDGLLFVLYRDVNGKFYDGNGLKRLID
jgi:hypothetical protein